MKRSRKAVICLVVPVMTALIVWAVAAARAEMGPMKTTPANYTTILVINSGIAFVNHLMSPMGVLIMAGIVGGFLATGKRGE